MDEVWLEWREALGVLYDKMSIRLKCKYYKTVMRPTNFV